MSSLRNLSPEKISQTSHLRAGALQRLLAVTAFGKNNPYARHGESMDKVTIEELPNTKVISGAKRWEEERGEFVQIAYRETMHHLAAFEIRKGYSRGDHYHEKKDEIFYVFRGKIRASLIDMDTLQKEEKILVKGNRIRVKPRCGHRFYGLEDTLVVEYSPQVYDKEDSYKVNLD